MIKKSLLPVRLVKTGTQKFFADECSQSADPILECFAHRRYADEQMNVIRHYHISADGHIVF